MCSTPALARIACFVYVQMTDKNSQMIFQDDRRIYTLKDKKYSLKRALHAAWKRRWAVLLFLLM